MFDIKNYLAIDFETTIELYQKPRVLTVKEYGKEPEILYRFDKEGETPKNLSALKEYIESFKGVIIQNAWFDIPLLNQWGIYPKMVYDTHLAEYLIKAGEKIQSTGLAALVLNYCGVEISKAQQCSDWGQELSEEQIHYIYEDVNYLHEIALKQIPTLNAQNTILTFVVRCAAILRWAGDVWEGIPIDTNACKDLRDNCYQVVAEEYIKLLKIVPIEACMRKGLPYKDLVQLSVEAKKYNPNVEELPTKCGKNTKYANATDAKTRYDYEPLREYFIEHPLDDRLMNLGDTNFAKHVLPKYGVKGGTTPKGGESFDASSLASILEKEIPEDAREIINIIFTLRKMSNIKDRFVREDHKQLGEFAGHSRIKPDISYTVTGRLTFTPFSQFPKEDDSRHPLENEIPLVFKAPPGFKTLTLDYSSQESVAAACFYRDANALKTIQKKLDPHLLFASKLFGEFEYTDASQTKELKKQFKALRTAVKGANFAKVYACSANKFHSLAKTACEKQGIPLNIEPIDLENKWGELYPAILRGQRHMGRLVAQGVLAHLKPETDNEEYWFSHTGWTKSADQMKNENAKKANGIRRSALQRSNMVLVSRSPLGLAKITPLYRGYNTIPINKDTTYVSEEFNYPIQSSGSEILFLAILLVKTFYPSIKIPTAIHDSLVMFVPEEGINGIGLETIQKHVEILMRKAFWLVFNSSIEVDGGYVERGIK